MMLKNKRVLSLLSFLVILISSQEFNLFAGSKYGHHAIPLHQSHEYLQKNPTPDYWALSPYYMAQQDGRSCSVATVAMVVNAARKDRDLDAEAKLVTQKSVLQKTNDAAWKKSVGPLGYGVTLDQLSTILGKSFNAYGIQNVKIETTHVDQTSTDTQEKLHNVLVKNEKSDRDFLVINFIQGTLTEDTGGGHIAVVGAYDAKNKKVLIMDPDREWYEPYWVSEELLLKSLATKDPASGKSRGYVWVNF